MTLTVMLVQHQFANQQEEQFSTETTVEELDERIKKEKERISNGEKTFNENIKTALPSETIIGYHNQNPLFEWLDITDPLTGKKERYSYYSAALPGFQLPDDPTKNFIYSHGVFYSRDV